MASTEIELRESIKKANSAVLQAELRVALPKINETCFTHFTVSRENLMLVINELRDLVGIETPIKTAICETKHSAIRMIIGKFFKGEIFQVDRTPDSEAISTNVLLAMMQQQLQLQIESRAEDARRHEEARLADARKHEEDARRHEEARLADARKHEEDARRHEEARLADARKHEEAARMHAERMDLLQRQIELMDRNRSLDREADIGSREVALQKQVDKQNNISLRIKFANDRLRGVISPMSEFKFCNIPLFFESLERIFELHKIDEDLWVLILVPLLNTKAKLLLGRIPKEDSATYAKLKERILKEMKLSKTEYWKQFSTYKKTQGETYVQFCSRMSTTLRYHVEATKIEQSYENMFDLVLGNKLRDCLPPDAKGFVIREEGEKHLNADQIASLADLFTESETIGSSFPNEYNSTKDFYAKDKKFSHQNKQEGFVNYNKEVKMGQYENNPQTFQKVNGGEQNKTQFTGNRQNFQNFQKSNGGEHSKIQFSGNRPHFQNFQQNGNFAKQPPKEGFRKTFNSRRVKRGRQFKSVNRVAVEFPTESENAYNDVAQNKAHVKNYESDESETGFKELYDSNETVKHINRVQNLGCISSVSNSVFVTSVKECENTVAKDFVIADNFVYNELSSKHCIEEVKPNVPITDREHKCAAFHLQIEGCKESRKFIYDTGSEITIIPESALPQNWNADSANALAKASTVVLKAAFGQTIEAKLININCRFVSKQCKLLGQGNVYSTICVAVTPKLNDECIILCHDDCDVLFHAYELIVPEVIQISNSSLLFDKSNISSSSSSSSSSTVISSDPYVCSLSSFNEKDTYDNFIESNFVMLPADEAKHSYEAKYDSILVNKGIEYANVYKTEIPDVLNVEENSVLNTISATEFGELQINDKSLENAFRSAKLGKSEFFVNNTNSLLYRSTEMGGRKINQLVLPGSLRSSMIERAHSYHIGMKRTYRYIASVFYWPGMKKEIFDNILKCVYCQKNRRKTVADNVPICHVKLPTRTLSHWNMDVLTSIDCPSSKGHKYVLVCIEQVSRFPVCYPLKTQSAKEICNCVLNLYCTYGVSQIFTDNGTCFVSELPRMLYDKLGVNLVTAAPNRSQSYGLVERLVGTVSNALETVCKGENSRSWHEHLDFIMWTLRQQINEDTGLHLIMYFLATRGGPLYLF